MNLVVYGSLMKKAERDRAGVSSSDALPVTVDGYTRSFDQMPSWRRGDGKNVAVLSAREAPERRMNAVLLLEVSGDLTAADHRERGYERRRLDGTIRHGEGRPLRIAGSTYIYAGRPDRRGQDVLPNREYLRICLEGAGEWGAAFYEDFLQTTFLGDGRALEDYVSSARQARELFSPEGGLC